MARAVTRSRAGPTTSGRRRSPLPATCLLCESEHRFATPTVSCSSMAKGVPADLMDSVMAGNSHHPIHVHPVRPLYRFTATALGASMWFFVRFCPSICESMSCTDPERFSSCTEPRRTAPLCWAGSTLGIIRRESPPEPFVPIDLEQAIWSEPPGSMTLCCSR